MGKSIDSISPNSASEPGTTETADTKRKGTTPPTVPPVTPAKDAADPASTATVAPPDSKTPPEVMKEKPVKATADESNATASEPANTGKVQATPSKGHVESTDATAESDADTLDAAQGDPPATPDSPAPADSYANLFPEPSVVIGNPPSWIMWGVLLVASVLVGVVGFQLINDRLDSWLAVSDQPSPSAAVSASPNASPDAQATPTATPADSPAPSPTTSPSPAASPSPSPATSPSAEPSPVAVDKAAITLRVLNGTTISGEAAKVESELKAAGFTVRTIGNAKNQTYTNSFIYYQAGKRAQAETVQQALKNRTFMLEESTLAAPDQVLVVIGLQ
jgi:hypothetical protein